MSREKRFGITDAIQTVSFNPEVRGRAVRLVLERAGQTSSERERIRFLEREVRELRQTNEILHKASAYFAQAELDRRFKAFVDEHRAVYGVEPICRVLLIAPSTYYAHARCQADPERRSRRTT